MILAELAPRCAAASKQQPQPELDIRADRNARYESVAQVMSAAAKAGMVRIGFFTSPQRLALMNSSALVT